MSQPDVGRLIALLHELYRPQVCIGEANRYSTAVSSC
jgi:hypothetical protein